MNYTIDTNNIKVTNAIASVINSAFETGLNPAWFQVESLNKDGFLDAAFADSDLPTPSKKPARTDWSINVRLWDEDNDEPIDDLGYTTVTAEFAAKRLNEMANSDKSPFLRSLADAYLRYLVAIQEGDDKMAERILFDQYEPDGCHDDALAQYIVHGDVIFG